jgi:hypothetical protein
MLANAAVRAVMPMSARHLAWAWKDNRMRPGCHLQRPKHLPELEPLGVL